MVYINNIIYYKGIIPFTTDMDIGMWIEEFEEKVLDEFIGNPHLRLLLSFGESIIFILCIM